MAVLQSRNHGSLHTFLILQLLLLQSCLDVDLLPHSLLSQLTVQLIDAPVSVSNQSIQIICAQLPRWKIFKSFLYATKYIRWPSANCLSNFVLRNSDHKVKNVFATLCFQYFLNIWNHYWALKVQFMKELFRLLYRRNDSFLRFWLKHNVFINRVRSYWVPSSWPGSQVWCWRALSETELWLHSPAHCTERRSLPPSAHSGPADIDTRVIYSV